MTSSRYLSMFLAAMLVWCALFLVVTSIVNPYGVSPLQVSIKRVNEFKPMRRDIDRIIKPYEVWRYQPNTIFLGTSRIHQSIDPAVLDGTKFAPAYNASIPASSLGLNISHLRQYIEFNPQLRTVVVELFLYNFLGQGQERAPKQFMDYLRNTANLFISADTLWASVLTVGYNLVKRVPVYEIKPGGYYYYPPGHDARGPFNGFPEGIWKLHETRAKGMQLHEPAFDVIEEFSEIARSHNLQLIFVLTPNHAYDDYYLHAIDAWPKVEEWLRRVSAEGVVYSFSQPNEWVYEPVQKYMKYWNDPYHFSLEMGRAMQKSLVNGGTGAPDNFMIRMTPHKVAEHVRGRREAIREWAQKNPEFVARFSEEKSKWEQSYNKKNNK